MTKEDFDNTIDTLNKLVITIGKESALEGLHAVTIAFGALLDVYAEKGMCSDKDMFRKIFSNIIERGPNGN